MVSSELSHWRDAESSAAIGHAARRWQRRHLAAVVAAACIGLALSAGTWYAAVNREDRLAEEDLKARTNNQALLLQSGIRQYVGKIAALHALFEADDSVSRQEFQSFSNALLQDQTAILAMTWLPRVSHDQLAAHEREGAAQGLTGYRVKSAATDGSSVPAPEKAEHFPVFYSSTEPLGSPLYGLDIADGGLRQRTLDRARLSGDIASSEPFCFEAEKATATASSWRCRSFGRVCRTTRSVAAE